MLSCSISFLDFSISFHGVAISLPEQTLVRAQDFLRSQHIAFDRSGRFFDLDKWVVRRSLSYLMRLPQA
jgi:hypothetical protein